MIPERRGDRHASRRGDLSAAARAIGRAKACIGANVKYDTSAPSPACFSPAKSPKNGQNEAAGREEGILASFPRRSIRAKCRGSGDDRSEDAGMEEVKEPPIYSAARDGAFSAIRFLYIS